MNRLTTLLHSRPVLAHMLVAVLAALAGVLVFVSDRALNESKRLESLQVDANRGAARMLASTLNGELMGAINLLGLIDTNIKQEARGGTEVERGSVITTLGKVGRAIGAQCLFVVGQDGTIASFWERDGPSSSGLDVALKPYYRLALQGQSSIYPSVNLARVDQRALYYAAPVYGEVARATVGDGAVVACTQTQALEQLLDSAADEALLISPLGVVYASKHAQWLGALAGEPTPERLEQIRAQRQFGSFFSSSAPQRLALPVVTGLSQQDGQRWAMARSPLAWNDPAGDWQLVLMEDLRRTVPVYPIWLKSGATVLVSLLLGYMGLSILRASQARARASAQLRQFAQQQQDDVRYRTDLARSALRLQNCEAVPELAQVFFQEARHLLGAQQGALYVQASDDDASALVLAGAAACAEAPPARLTAGQGLLGQCALERRQQVIATPPDGYWTLRCGLGQTRPGALLLTPLLMHDALIGVLELGLMQPPEAETLRKSEELTSLLTNALEILRRRRPAATSGTPTPIPTRGHP